MFDLLGHIVFASAFTLCLKWLQIRGKENIVAVGAINYITAAVLIFPRFYASTKSEPINLAAVLTGAAMGACYFTAFFFVIYLIKRVGAASATVVGSLSILFPISFAAMLWNEIPNAYQWIGICLAITSLSLIGATKSKATESHSDSTAFDNISQSNNANHFVWILLGFFILAGSSRLAQRAFGHLSTEIHRSTFLFSAFAISGTASLVLLVARKKLITRGEICIGLGLGTTNILHTGFLMKSLDQYPGYIIFPIASAGGLVFTTITAAQFMGERNSRKTLLGISMAVIALVLLNINV